MSETEAAPEPLPPPWQDTRDHDAVRITALRTVVTAPHGPPLVVVRVETNQPGLYGLGCATFQQRAALVVEAVEDFLQPLLAGRDVADITDIHTVATLSSYWRGSALLHHAVAGVDAALWDLAGKIAGLPVHRLLGGRVRAGAYAYTHAAGATPEEVGDGVEAALAEGYRHVRCQVGVPGMAVYGYRAGGRHGHHGGVWDARATTRATLRMFEHVRERFGEEPELLHDAHERLVPQEAVEFARALEPFGLYFLEDPLAPEDSGHLPRLRSLTSTPIAMSELFTDTAQWLPLVSGRLVDFARANVGALGGLTAARRMTTLAAFFGIRTAFHSPADVSPVGQATNLHLALAAPNFGVQEYQRCPDAVREVFPGAPTPVRGVLDVDDTRPGWGVDLDEKQAAAYPPDPGPRRGAWEPVRRPDGTVLRP